MEIVDERFVSQGLVGGVLVGMRGKLAPATGDSRDSGIPSTFERRPRYLCTDQRLLTAKMVYRILRTTLPLPDNFQSLRLMPCLSKTVYGPLEVLMR